MHGENKVNIYVHCFGHRPAHIGLLIQGNVNVRVQTTVILAVHMTQGLLSLSLCFLSNLGHLHYFSIVNVALEMTFLKQCRHFFPEESVNFLYAVNLALRMKGIRLI
jgi:hypothetical protein